MATSILLAALVFVLDVTTVGQGVDALYALPLLASAFSEPPRFQFLAATAVSALTIGGALHSIGRVPLPDVIANRAVVLVLIWATAIVVTRFRSTWSDLQARTKDLADVNYAIDQSAIVATTDTRGRITYVNEQFCTVSGYARDELLGQDHRMLNSGFHPPEFIRDLWVTIANGRNWHGEIRNRTKDGSLYWVDTTIVPFLDERGKPYQYMALRYEITARKHTQERLREQESLARLGQMAAVVAHEVKNPIAGIRGALQVIASRMPPDARDRPIVGEVIARLDGLNAIVEDLLIFARPRQPRAEPVHLEHLVRATLELLARDPLFTDLRVCCPPSSVVIAGDGEQLRLVLTNVLMNAAQAMGGQGEVRVDITPGPLMVTLSVTDRGPGMAPDLRAKVFEPFFTTRHRGTGLGLPIARRIVDAHGGTIDLREAPGGGTAVVLQLPVFAGRTVNAGDA